jgi:hypothetical protein
LQGPGNIGTGIQGIHEENPSDNRFHVPYSLNTAGDLHPGLIGKGNKMKGIADTEEFGKEGTGKIIPQLLVRAAHSGGCIQNQYQINRISRRRAFLTGRKRKNTPQKHENAYYFFYGYPLHPINNSRHLKNPQDCFPWVKLPPINPPQIRAE